MEGIKRLILIWGNSKILFIGKSSKDRNFYRISAGAVKKDMLQDYTNLRPLEDFHKYMFSRSFFQQELFKRNFISRQYYEDVKKDNMF